MYESEEDKKFKRLYRKLSHPPYLKTKDWYKSIKNTIRNQSTEYLKNVEKTNALELIDNLVDSNVLEEGAANKMRDFIKSL